LHLNKKFVYLLGQSYEQLGTCWKNL